MAGLENAFRKIHTSKKKKYASSCIDPSKIDEIHANATNDKTRWGGQIEYLLER